MLPKEQTIIYISCSIVSTIFFLWTKQNQKPFCVLILTCYLQTSFLCRDTTPIGYIIQSADDPSDLGTIWDKEPSVFLILTPKHLLFVFLDSCWLLLMSCTDSSDSNWQWTGLDSNGHLWIYSDLLGKTWIPLVTGGKLHYMSAKPSFISANFPSIPATSDSIPHICPRIEWTFLHCLHPFHCVVHSWLEHCNLWPHDRLAWCAQVDGHADVALSMHPAGTWFFITRDFDHLMSGHLLVDLGCQSHW